tara:strand:+ start:112 stop:1065 length:954 start_codon:yes stop_codon:yes gene_type:complete
MATTKVIPGVLDLTQASSSTGLRMPKGAAYSGAAADPAMVRNSSETQSAGSLNVMQHFNGTDWKNYENFVQCTTSTCGYPSAASSNALALYQLQSDGGAVNNVPDTCGSYDGTASNITYAAGKFGNAAVFNGNNSKIAIGSIFGSTFGTQNTQNFSFSGWFKINTAYSSSLPYSTIIGGDITNSSGLGGPYMILLEGTSTANEYYFNTSRYYGTTATYGANSPNQTLLVDTWYHYVETYTASATSGQSRSVKYLNGSEISNSVVEGSSSNATTNSNLALGQYRDGLAVWDGSIDQVRLYDSVLSQNDVDDLFLEVAC